VDPENIRKSVLDAGILIAVGLGSFKPDTIRIGHMGDIRVEDVERTLDVLPRV
jgi:aspartate aminotransferase-like enzyme